MQGKQVTEGNVGQGNGQYEYPLAAMQGIVQRVYITIWSISAAIFSFALIFIGIKLATETIAHQKAKYKEALLSWAVGLVMLFLIHFFMSFILSLNEELVMIASSLVPQGGENVTSLATYFRDNLVEGWNPFTGGVLAAGFKMNFTNVVLWGILLGQSLIVLFAYFKRLFYILVLGFFAPAIVVINTYQKALSGKGSSLANWGKEFITTVMEQTMQAFIYAVIMNIVISIMTSGDEAKTGAGLIAIGALFIVLKVDDIIKKLIGWSDGMSGGLSGGFKSLVTMAALASRAKNAGMKVADNFTKFKEGRKVREKADNDYAESKRRYELEKQKYGTYDPETNQVTAVSSANTENQIKEAATQAINATVIVEDERQGKDTTRLIEEIANLQKASAEQMAQLLSSAKQGGQIGILGQTAANGLAGKTAIRQVAGVDGGQALPKENKPDSLKAYNAYAASQKAEADHNDALKKAKELRRQGVVGTLGAASFGLTGATLAAGSGDIVKVVAGLTEGTAMGDNIGESLAKLHTPKTVKRVGNSVDKLTNYQISDMNTDLANRIDDIKLSVNDVKKNLVSKSKVHSAGDTKEILTALSKREKVITTRQETRIIEQQKRTGTTSGSSSGASASKTKSPRIENI